jgi:hypothetical protein
MAMLNYSYPIIQKQKVSTSSALETKYQLLLLFITEESVIPSVLCMFLLLLLPWLPWLIPYKASPGTQESCR